MTTALSERAGAVIRGLVCGFAEPMRSNRLLLMLKAYVDDSNIGQGPVAVLAGWIAPAARWETFSEEWDMVLRMSPRIEYFKWNEALTLGGQFHGISPERRDEKVKLLVDVLNHYRPLGIASAIPNDLHRTAFAGNPSKNMRSPYGFLLYSLVTQLLNRVGNSAAPEKIDFIFDIQPGKEADVFDAWQYMRETAEPEIKAVMGRLNFEDDKEVKPLQAADLSAGWTREQCEGVYSEIEPRPFPFGSPDLRLLIRYWTPELLLEMIEKIEGKEGPG